MLTGFSIIDLGFLYIQLSWSKPRSNVVSGQGIKVNNLLKGYMLTSGCELLSRIACFDRLQIYSCVPAIMARNTSYST